MYSVILPIYNQKENLPIILYLLHEVATKQYFIHRLRDLKMQVLLVEDNSPDGTRQIARQLSKHFALPKIILIERERKMGLGSAYREALYACRGQFVIIMDADLSHHPKYIPQMIKTQKQSNADIVTGTRYKGDGGVEGWSFFRKLTSRTANFIASLSLSTQFSDLTGSFRLYKKKVLQQLISLTTTVGYSFQMEILIRGQKSGKIIKEIPIVFVDRLYGKSKLGPNEVWIYLKGVLQLFLAY